MIYIIFEIKYMVLVKKCDSFSTYRNQKFNVQPKLCFLNNKPTLNPVCNVKFT